MASVGDSRVMVLPGVVHLTSCCFGKLKPCEPADKKEAHINAGRYASRCDQLALLDPACVIDDLKLREARGAPCRPRRQE